MDKIRIIFFGSKPFYSQLVNHLSGRIRLKFFPLSANLNGENHPINKTLVILLNNQAGKQKLVELRKSYPNLSILMLAENPAQDDLLNAIRLGVREFLILPLNEGELEEAIKNVILPPASKKVFKDINIFKGLSQLFTRLKNLSPFFPQNLHSSPAVLGINPFPGSMTKAANWDEKTCNLHVSFFGELKVTLWGKKIPKVKGNKNNSLFAYLLYHHHKPINREVLKEKFWGNYPPSSARNSLNVAIYAIRKHLEKYAMKQEIIILENNCYSINPALDIYTDVEHFRQLCQKGRATERSQSFESALVIFQKALSLYKGDFLENMRFEDWCEPERDNLKETFLFILTRLSLHFFKQDEFDACINICKRMLVKDQCLEDAHRLLMQCYCQIGLRDLAKKQYLKCEKILKEEFNMAPSVQTQHLFEEIRSGKIVPVL